MRLIDADKFKKQVAGMAIINNFPPNKANALCELINKQPTAFDADMVMEQLEEYIRESNNADYNRAMIEAIEVIKSKLNTTK